MEKEKRANAIVRLIPNIAKKLGDHSVKANCACWYHQPTVPKSMKKDQNMKTE